MADGAARAGVAPLGCRPQWEREHASLQTVADAAIVRATLLQDALREHCDPATYVQILRRIDAMEPRIGTTGKA